MAACQTTLSYAMDTFLIQVVVSPCCHAESPEYPAGDVIFPGGTEGAPAPAMMWQL